MENSPSRTQLLQQNKIRNLVLGIAFDIIGTMSFAIPVLAEFSDVVWAPVSGLLMVWLYPGSKGKVAGVVAAAEELLPFTDIVPTFTIMWFYTYLFTRPGAE